MYGEYNQKDYYANIGHSSLFVTIKQTILRRFGEILDSPYAVSLSCSEMLCEIFLISTRSSRLSPLSTSFICSGVRIAFATERNHLQFLHLKTAPAHKLPAK